MKIPGFPIQLFSVLSCVVAAFITSIQFSISSMADVVYPGDTILDVTLLGADPTGVNDSTAVIQDAMDDFDGNIYGFRVRYILYFPNGTYRLTAPLILDTHDAGTTGGGSLRGIIFQGQSRDGVVLKLDDATAGFGDPLNPQILVDFNESNEMVGSWQFVGFQIHIKDMTIDVGSGNPGAIGLDFTANNCGGLENLLIRTSDPGKAGHTGLLLSSIPGPQFFSDIEVDGFDYGMRTLSNPNYQTTMEDIVVRNSLINGIQNNFTSMNIHRLRTDNIGQAAVQNNNEGAFMLIVDGDFQNGNPAYPAIDNNGFLYARNVRMDGHSHLIDDHLAGNLSGPAISEWFSGSAETLFPADMRTSLNLPIEDAPDIPRDPPSEWVSIAAFGAAPGNDTAGAAVSATIDDAPAVQAAMDSMGPGQPNEGKRTLYFPGGFPTGQYIFKTGVIIPSYVERIVGCYTAIQPLAAAKDTVPCFTIASGGGEPLIIEQLTSDWSDQRPEEDTAGPGDYRRASPFIKNESDRTVVLKDIWVSSGQVYRNTGNGKLFIENVSGTSGRYGGISIPEPLPSAVPQFDFGAQDVWARQLNAEQKNIKVQSSGGDVWILGIKNEEDGPLVKAVGGSRTEVLGGLIMPLDVDDQVQAGFEIVDSAMSIVIPAHTRSSPKLKPDLSGYYDLFHDVFVRESRGPNTEELLTASVSQNRGYHTTPPKVLTLFRGSTYTAAENWRLTHFDTLSNSGDAADSANPDDDFLTNSQERAYGRNPLTPETDNPVTGELIDIGNQPYLALTFDQLTSGTGTAGLDYTAAGITYAVEHNSQLTGTWESALAPLTLHSGPVDNGNGVETVTVRMTDPLGSTTPGDFLRLRTTETP